jgi:hypothetical protein
MLAGVMDDFSAEIGGRPGTKKRGQEDQDRARAEDQAEQEISPGAIRVNRERKEMQEGDREVRVIDDVKAKAQPENEAEDQKRCSNSNFVARIWRISRSSGRPLLCL